MKNKLFLVVFFIVAGFSMVFAEAPSGLEVTQNDTITELKWSTSGDAESYNVYHATGASGKFNTFPEGWTIIATVLPTPTYTTHSYADITGNTYTYYLVTSMEGTTESAKSSMGVKTVLGFTYTEGAKNTYRISLPYVSQYDNASDVVTYLEGSLTTTPTKINNISLWIPSTQSFVPYGYKESVGAWVGTDWSVDPYGLSMNAMYLHAISSFNWVVTGTDVSTPLIFNYNSGMTANNNKRMIPYTSNYATVSDIVLEIEGAMNTNTKINRLSVWVPSTQSYSAYNYNTGMQSWLGTNFNIIPGDALNINVSGNTSSFTWQPTLKYPSIP